MATTLLVLLVRHGQSEANAVGRFAFRTWDPGLTPLGQAEARSLVEQLRGTSIRSLVSSPLRRARETLAPLARDRQLPVAVMPELSELNMGGWDGGMLSEIALREQGAWQAWRRDPDANPPPRGERLSTVGARVLQGLDQLRSQEGLVVAATHADCIKGALARILGVSGPSSRRVSVPNLGQLLLRAADDGTWRIVLGPIRPPADI